MAKLPLEKRIDYKAVIEFLERYPDKHLAAHACSQIFWHSLKENDPSFDRYLALMRHYQSALATEQSSAFVDVLLDRLGFHAIAAKKNATATFQNQRPHFTRQAGLVARR